MQVSGGVAMPAPLGRNELDHIANGRRVHGSLGKEHRLYQMAWRFSLFRPAPYLTAPVASQVEEPTLRRRRMREFAVQQLPLSRCYFHN